MKRGKKLTPADLEKLKKAMETPGGKLKYVPRPPLERIADSLALLVKLGCMNRNISVGDLRAARLMDAQPDKPPVVLNQTAQELEELARTQVGSAEELEYLTQAMAGGPLKARLEALRGEKSV